MSGSTWLVYVNSKETLRGGCYILQKMALKLGIAIA